MRPRKQIEPEGHHGFMRLITGVSSAAIIIGRDRNSLNQGARRLGQVLLRLVGAGNDDPPIVVAMLTSYPVLAVIATSDVHEAVVQPGRLHVEPGEEVQGVLAAELQLPVLLLPVLVHIAQELTVAF